MPLETQSADVSPVNGWNDVVFTPLTVHLEDMHALDSKEVEDVGEGDGVDGEEANPGTSDAVLLASASDVTRDDPGLVRSRRRETLP
eukprot:CAMPEP_0175970308 /NCGR_PEP_ID=MMETSP0108-20121206/40978_1 /TAXON_ID=195067 ORGANISM="Goniomonas pacifica, Strain CCMP1869" /NCGR_SAMPLE_ID=MMETSP0108 /ASSEMBLY_ACC=CAM_ASM_000204 /LENGTH=86 /DNA_ID=CAMNT_0017299253 /DNA_START=187 /DNA_END=445 /DNA_ORIENTATION=+